MSNKFILMLEVMHLQLHFHKRQNPKKCFCSGYQIDNERVDSNLGCLEILRVRKWSTCYKMYFEQVNITM